MGFEKNFGDFFRELTGFTPSPFQMRVGVELLNGHNVVLRAPTGSGKTWAVVAPFLYSLNQESPIVDRLLYALPLRSLATSLHDSTQQALKNFKQAPIATNDVCIQTGERRDDPLFEARLTFTTIDQLLSSYLLQPVGLPERLANINAGALLGSLICFDEFHLLEPARSMGTALELLQTVAVKHRLSRFVLMTATLANETLEWLTRQLNATLIEVSENEAAKLPNEIGKQRYYRWVEAPLSAMAVAEQHQQGRSIVIANTVTRAQQLFEELQSETCRAALGPQTQIRLLHSRFFPNDRQRIEQDLAHWFGLKPTVEDVILVSTQVIEAGLDFSCDNLHTEVAPMNSLVQRGGRCARRRQQTGTVWCYALATTKYGDPAYGPYRDLSTIVDETARALSERPAQDSTPMTFYQELELVNRVHTNWEQSQLKPFENISSRSMDVRKSMNERNPAAVRDLVRDVSSINVVISDQPEAISFNRREWPDMLSVPPTSLFALFSKENGASDETRQPGGWIVKAACEQDVFQGGEIGVTWKKLTKFSELMSAGWLLAIHPDYATYDPEMGLRVGISGASLPISYRKRPKAERYSYRRETYAQHVHNVCNAGIRRDPLHAVIASRLATALQTTTTQLADWLLLVYQLHDVGKLSVGWQDAVWKWQEFKTGPESSPREPLAHTDYDPEVDFSLRQPKRPPHAAEGAYAVLGWLESRIDDDNVVAAILTAIVRHHGAFTSTLNSFTLIPAAGQYVAETLRHSTDSVELSDSPRPSQCEVFSSDLIAATVPESELALLLYFYLVRRLRIADQNSFEEN